MAKQLLLNVLVDTLGTYVEGLSPENLKLGVWSGEVHLNNLQLKSGILDALNLPVKILNGSLKSLILKVPWASLESKPVQITIDGVYLLAVPLDIKTLSSEEAKTKAFLDRKSIIKAAEDRVISNGQQPDSNEVKAEKSSYFKQLSSKIIDNLEVKLTNVHIRYEDAITLPNKIFSTGITLDTISLSTTDLNWEEKFISRAETSISINKLGRMENFAIYWTHTNSQRLENIANVEDWEREMKGLIFTSNASADPKSLKGKNIVKNDLNYVVVPPNRLTVKCVHTDYSRLAVEDKTKTEKAPKFIVSVDSSSLLIDFDGIQYRELIATKQMLEQLGRQKRLAANRPKLRPKEDPRGWWKFAYLIVTGRPVNQARKLKTAIQCAHARPRYLKLLRRYHTKPPPPPDELRAINTALEVMDKTLPLPTLVLFRQLGALEYLEHMAELRKQEVALAKKKTVSAPQQERSWAQWLGGSASAPAAAKSQTAEEKDDVLQLQQLHEQLFSTPVGPRDDQPLLAVSLKSSLQLTVRSAGMPVVTMGLAAVSSLELLNLETKVSFSLNDFFIADEFSSRASATAAAVYLVHPQPQQAASSTTRLAPDQANCLCGISYRSITVPPRPDDATAVSTTTSSLEIRSTPVDIFWNELCIQKLLSIFKIPNSATTTSPGKPSRLLEGFNRMAAEARLPQGASSLLVTVEVSAPKISIPRLGPETDSLLLLDMGSLMVHGQLSAAGAQLTLDLRDLNVDINGADGSSKGHILEPFTFAASLQQQVESPQADAAALPPTFCVDAQLSALRADVDLSKILLLLQAARRVSGVFAALPGDASSSSSADCMTPLGNEVEMLPLPLPLADETSPPPAAPPTSRLVSVSLLLPIAAVSLAVGSAAEEPRHVLLLAADRIFVSFLQRPYDTQLLFQLRSLSMEDSARPAAQRTIIATPLTTPSPDATTTASEDCFITLSYISLSNSLSPHHSEAGSAVLIDFQFRHLSLHVDPASTLRLRPLIAGLVQALPPSSPPTTSLPGHALAAADDEGVSHAVGTTVVNKPAGLRFDLRVGSISLCCLRSTDSLLDLEPAYVASLCGVTASFDSRPTTGNRGAPKTFQLECKAFSVLDQRRCSINYINKELLGRCDTAAASESDHLLSVSYQDDGCGNQVAVVVLSHATSYLTLDSALDLVAVVLENNAALQAVLSALSLPAATAVQTPRRLQEVPQTSLRLSVRLVDPRLLFLEEPSDASTRAVVCTCSLLFSYSSTAQGSQTADTTCLSLRQAQLFVLLRLDSSIPQQIVVPTLVEIHLQRAHDFGSTLTNTLTVDVSSLDAKISVNDLQLVSSVMRRLKAASPPSASSPPVAVTQPAVPALQKDRVICIQDISVSINSLVVQFVDDSSSLVRPVLRLSLTDAVAQLQGGMGVSLDGEVSFATAIDHFNSRNVTWEPIVEAIYLPVIAKVAYTDPTSAPTVDLSISAVDSLQVNVSGAMCRDLLQYAALVASCVVATERRVTQALVFVNHLGAPVSITPTGTMEKFTLELPADDTIQTTLSREQLVAMSVGDASLEAGGASLYKGMAFDLHLLGEAGAAREPLLALPISAAAARYYDLVPIRTTGVTAVGEPITEEIYENERWDMIWQNWTKPLQGCEFTDSNGKGNRNPTRVSLPSDRWQWLQAAWTVDLSSSARDRDGWEYAPTLSTFSASSRPRQFQLLDSGRRRRWVRSRALRADVLAEELAARRMTVVWDVRTAADGSKIVHLFSGLRIYNAMPFPVEVLVRGGEGDNLLGPVAEGGTKCLPLSAASLDSMLRVRPATCGDWSEGLECRGAGTKAVSAVSTLSRDLTCSQPDGAKAFQLRGCCTRLSAASTQSLLVAFLPHSIVFNHLPCSILYKCTAQQRQQQHGTLVAGSSDKLIFADPSQQPVVSFLLEGYAWSDPISLPMSALSAAIRSVSDKRFRKTTVIDLLSPEDKRGGLSLSVLVKIGNYTDDADRDVNLPVIEMHVFSRFVLVDRTASLGLVLRTKRRRTQLDGERTSVIERRSCGSFPPNDVAASWIRGSNGVALFQADDDKAVIGLMDHSRGSKMLFRDEAIDLSNMDEEKTRLEITDDSLPPNAKNVCCYQLAYSLTSLPGSFAQTQMLTVMNCYTIVNGLTESLHVRQTAAPTGPTVTVSAGCCGPWHKGDRLAGTALQLRTDSTSFSIGTLDINDIGVTSLLLIGNSTEQTRSNNIVINVEVKFSEPGDYSYITVVVWSSPEGAGAAAPLSVQNETDLPLTVRQNGLSFKQLKLDPQLCELLVPPRSWVPLGLPDPGLGRLLQVVAGKTAVTPDSPLARAAVVNLGKVGFSCDLDTFHLRSESGEQPSGEGYDINDDVIELVVVAEGGGKVLRARKKSAQILSELTERKTLSSVSVRLQLPCLSLSLVAERPQRRELLCGYLDGVDFYFKNSILDGNSGLAGEQVTSTAVELQIADVQVDNYCETAFFPILLHTYSNKERKTQMRKNKLESRRQMNSTDSTPTIPAPSGMPALRLLIARDVSSLPHSIVKFQHIAVQLLKITVHADSASVQMLVEDLIPDLVASRTADELLSHSNPVAWMNAFNQRTVVPEALMRLVDVPTELRAVGSGSCFFKVILLHPVNIDLSFENIPPLPHNSDLSEGTVRRLEMLHRIVSFEDFSICLKSFLVNDAVESSRGLLHRVSSAFAADLRSKLVQIAGQFVGSLSIIGNPVGLYRNIGEGVTECFYEPTEDLLASPVGFVSEVGQRAGLLIGHVASGVLSSSASIVEGASLGFARGTAMLDGDTNYSKKVDETRRKNMKSNDGIMFGLQAGGQSVLTGFTAGIKGMVAKPMEEGKKGGALGFVKGIGLGAIGAVVKPMQGVGDGIANVALGVSRQMDTLSVDEQGHVMNSVRRPSRALEAVDGPEVLTMLELLKAHAKDLVLRLARRDSIDDRYLGCEAVQHNDGLLLVVSEKFVHVLQPTVETIKVKLRVPFANISHAILRLDQQDRRHAVELVVFGTARESIAAEGPGVPCAGRDTALRAYSLLYQSRRLFSNPSLMVSPHVAVIQTSTALLDATKAYTFGSVNSKKFASSCNKSEKQVLGLARDAAAAVSASDPATMDEVAWRLLGDWAISHGTGLQGSRCMVLLMLNASSSAVQFLSINITEGRKYCVMPFGNGGFDSESQSVLPGGAVMLFAYGFVPTILDLSHVKIKVSTSAFEALCSTRSNRSNSETKGTHSVAFLEKSLTDWWAKYVIQIS